MIRDPSDGTVREAVRHRPETLKPKANLPETADFGTGLRQPTRTDAQERLEESRKWIKNYHAKKERENARGNDGEEYSADGCSIDDQGKAKS